VVLAELLADRIRITTPVAGNKGSTIELNAEDDVIVHLDRGKIAQVIDNFLTNTIKYSPKGSTVFASLTHDEQSATVTVRDEGPGIPADEVSKVFGDFQKLSVRPTDGEQSTGLGLAIVKRLVDAHGGSVGVHSVEGEGAAFYLSLPLGNRD